MYQIRRSAAYLFIVLALFFHMTALRYVEIRGIAPDILTIVVVFFAFFYGPRVGLEIGLAAGLLRDLLSSDLFGVNMCVMGMTGLVIGTSSSKVYRESKALQVMFVFLGTVLSIVVHGAIESLAARATDLRFGAFFFTSALPSGLYTAVVSAFLFAKGVKMFRLEERRDYL